MKRTALSVLVLATILSACESGVPSSPTAMAGGSESMGRNAGDVSLPISGRCSETIVETPLDFLPPPFEEFAAHAKEAGVGSCQIAHLGRSTVNSTVDGDFTLVPFPYAGRRVYTAANGDELWTTESGHIDPPENRRFTQSGVVTFIGGTGRFTRAVGSADYTASGVVTSFGRYTIDARFEGTIIY
jgi:hypothetical protein